MKRAMVYGLLVISLALGAAHNAFAAGAVEIGGKTAVSANFSVTSTNPDELPNTDTVYLGTTLTRTTQDARWEYGIGFALTAFIADAFEASFFTPSAQIRINSDLLGPEENILGYLGFIAGVTIIDLDAGEFKNTDEVGAFGPKFGAEYYVTSNFALQLEDSLLFDTDKGITNTLAIGIKLLF